MGKYGKPPVSKPVRFPTLDEVFARKPQPARGTGGDATRIYSGQGVAPLPSTPKTITPQNRVIKPSK